MPTVKLSKKKMVGTVEYHVKEIELECKKTPIRNLVKIAKEIVK